MYTNLYIVIRKYRLKMKQIKKKEEEEEKCKLKTL